MNLSKAVLARKRPPQDKQLPTNFCFCKCKATRFLCAHRLRDFVPTFPYVAVTIPYVVLILSKLSATVFTFLRHFALNCPDPALF